MDKLRELQNVETSMLAVFDRICRKHDIPYFVTFGTALGAKRHQGFIPWDDDIDVGMLRSDYFKLKEIAPDEWEGLVLIDGESECFYHEKVFPRVYKPGTILEAELSRKYTYNKENVKKPVWIDIFLYDYVDSKEIALKKAKQARKLHILYYYSKYWTNIVRTDSISKKMISIGKNILHLFISIRKPASYLAKYYTLVSQDTGHFLISYDSWTIKEIMDSFCGKNELYPPRDIQFEDIVVMAPRELEHQLESFYGNYMKLPPEEKRVGHIPHNIFLG